MTWMTFFGTEQRDLIQKAVSVNEIPEGVAIRLVDFEPDLKAIHALPLDEDFDTMVPAYGMTAENCSNELTLVATRDGKPIGQISADIEMMDSSFAEIDLFISGIFVSSEERRKGIGIALGKSLTLVVEAWRRAQAAHAEMSEEGGLTIGGDTEPESGGEVIVDMMQEYSDHLADLSGDDIWD